MAEEQQPKEKPSVKTRLSAEDLQHSHIVIVTARWVLVTAGLILSLWNPGPISRMRFQIFFIILLAFANFYLHAEILRKRPTAAAVAYLASLGDLFVITVIVISQGGFTSTAYPFYFPAILAYSVAFPMIASLLMTGGVLFAYLMICLISLAGAGATIQTADMQVVVARLIMFAGVAVCSYLYRKIESDRRAEASETRERLSKQVLGQA